jgi:amino acid transporter
MVAIAGRLRAENGGSFGWVLRGLGPTLARGFVVNAVSFVVFEWAIKREETLGET